MTQQLRSLSLRTRTLMARFVPGVTITGAGLLVGLMGIQIANAQTTSKAELATATFAGGCFWCTESDFDKVDGVVETVSGYIGGEQENPGYRAVSAGTTGHTEAVQIRFDSSVVSYASLLDIYWRSIDPTVKDRQFCDKGSQYRPEIFVHDAAQREQAEKSKRNVIATKPFPQDIVVDVTDAPRFWPAEDYHQDYHSRNPLRYTYYRKSCGRDKRLKELWGDS